MKTVYRITLILVFIVITMNILAQPVVQTFSSNTGHTATVTITKPVATAQNDLLVVGLTFEKGSAETITAPAGWTMIRRTNNSTDVGMATFRKFAGASEPSSYTFSLSNGSKWSIGMIRISNVDVTNPIDVTAAATGLGSLVSAPSINTLAPNRLVLCFYSNKKASTYNAAGSTSKIYDRPNTTGNQPSNMMASFVQASTGATGNKTATATDTESWASQQIAIAPLVVLPVTIKQFAIAPCNNGSTVCINWETSLEVNHDYFSIERSTNSITWEQIVKVENKGNSNSGATYSAIDATPKNGINYYRLKQVDVTGQATYSHYKSVLINDLSKKAFNIYPNPVVNSFTVETGEEEMENPKFYNLQNQEVTAGVQVINQTQNKTTFNISSLPPGIYLLRTKTMSTKIYKQ